jgi:hypothetical protein
MWQTPILARWSRRLSLGMGLLITILFASCGGGNVVGKQINFGQGSDSERYRVSGWSHTEEKFTWTEGTAAKLSLPVGRESAPLRLRVWMAAFTHPPDLPSQPVEVFIGGQKVAEWQVNSTPAEYIVALPANAAKGGGTLEVEFRTPKATSPKSVGLNDDRRVLGACLSWLEITKT